MAPPLYNQWLSWKGCAQKNIAGDIGDAAIERIPAFHSKAGGKISWYEIRDRWFLHPNHPTVGFASLEYIVLVRVMKISAILGLS